MILEALFIVWEICLHTRNLVWEIEQSNIQFSKKFQMPFPAMAEAGGLRLRKKACPLVSAPQTFHSLCKHDSISQAESCAYKLFMKNLNLFPADLLHVKISQHHSDQGSIVLDVIVPTLLFLFKANKYCTVKRLRLKGCGIFGVTQVGCCIGFPRWTCQVSWAAEASSACCASWSPPR